MQKEVYWRTMFPVLAIRNVRYYLSGQLISLIGTWAHQLAIQWIVYRETHDAYYVALAAFCSQIPIFCISPIAGVLLDGWNLHKVLKWTQSLSAVHAVILGLCAYFGVINVPMILVANIILGILAAVDTPARHSFMLQMLPDTKLLPQAIALNSSVIHGTRFLGPALGGVAIIWLGDAGCFFLNAFSFIAVLIALAFIEPRSRPPVVGVTVWRSFSEGLSFVRTCPPILVILCLLACMSFFAGQYAILLPSLAYEVLHGKVTTLSLMTSMTGIGPISAALGIALRTKVVRFGVLIAGNTMLCGAAYMTLAYLTNPILVFFCIWIISGSVMAQITSSHILLQTIVQDSKRARVMSLYSFSLFGFAPFGSIMVGMMMRHFGLTITLQFCGVMTLVTALVFALSLKYLSRWVKPMYLERDLLKPSRLDDFLGVF